MAYASASDVKTYLGITASTDDTLITALIARAQAMIDRETSSTFEAATDSTIYRDARANVSGRTLWLGQWVAAITTVTNGDGVVVASDEYKPLGGGPYYALKLLGSAGKAWTYVNDSEDAISIEGKIAYSTSAPADIAHATIRLTAFLYRQRENANDIDRAVVVGNATVLPAQLPADVAKIVAPYKPLSEWA